MERPMLSAAIDSCYKEDDIKEILKELVNIFDIEDRVYSLESEKENIPSIVFSFGDLDGKNFLKYIITLIQIFGNQPAIKL